MLSSAGISTTWSILLGTTVRYCIIWAFDLSTYICVWFFIADSLADLESWVDNHKKTKCGWDLAERLERLAVNAKVATVLASSDTVESEERQMKQCWITPCCGFGSGRIRNFWTNPDPIRNRNKCFGSWFLCVFKSGSGYGYETKLRPDTGSEPDLKLLFRIRNTGITYN